MFERNAPGDTFGWGVVFSDQTVENITANDPVSAADHHRRVRPLGRHRRPFPRRVRHLVGPRLHRHRPQAPARNPAGSRARARRRAALRSRVRSGRPRSGATTTWSSRPTAPTRASATRTPTRSESTSTSAPTSSSGSARPRCSTPSPSPSRRPSTAGSGRTPTASRPTARPSSSNVRKRRGARSASTGWTSPRRSRVCEKLFAKYLDGHTLMSNAAHLRGLGGLAQLPPHQLRALEPAATSSCSATPRTPRISRSARGTKLALEDAIKLAEVLNRDGPDRRSRARRISGGAQPRSAEAAEQRAQLDRMVRDAGPLSAFRAAAVRLLAAHPQPARQPREPAPARPRMAGDGRALVLEARDRRPLEQDRAADVRAVQAARDGRSRTASSSRRWRCIRRSTACPTTSTSCTSARARSAAPASSSPR